MDTVVSIIFVTLIAVGIFLIVYAQNLKGEKKEREESPNADTYQTVGIVVLILGVSIMIAFFYNKVGHSNRKSTDVEAIYKELDAHQK